MGSEEREVVVPPSPVPAAAWVPSSPPARPATVWAPPPPPGTRPGWPAPPPPRPASSRRWLLFVGAALALFGLGAALLVPDTERSDDTRPAPGWEDPDFQRLVTFVERERGLEFREPVPVEFLDEAAFVEELGSDGDLTDDDREEIGRDADLLRSLGLISAETDLAAAYEASSAVTTVGFYETEENRMVVRGTELDVPTRVTVVHELVHALQDQHLGLEALDQLEDSDAVSGSTALVEGDAVAVENAYVYGDLSDAERDEYFAWLDEPLPEPEGGVEIPVALDVLGAAPYDLGPALVDAIVADGGQAARDRAFAQPPSDEAQVLAPLTYLAGDGDDDVEAPPAAAGEDEARVDDFGAIRLFVVLSERIDAHEALRAADGWDGDELRLVEARGQACVRAAFATDSERDADELARALDEWAAAGPRGAATAGRDGDLVTLRACEPEGGAPEPSGASGDASWLPYERAELFRQFLDEGSSVEEAWCIAEGAVADLTIEELRDPDAAFYDDPGFTGRVEELQAGCEG